MFAIAFDLDDDNTQTFHPTGVRQAYPEIGAILSRLPAASSRACS